MATGTPAKLSVIASCSSFPKKRSTLPVASEAKKVPWTIAPETPRATTEAAKAIE